MPMYKLTHLGSLWCGIDKVKTTHYFLSCHQMNISNIQHMYKNHVGIILPFSQKLICKILVAIAMVHQAPTLISQIYIINVKDIAKILVFHWIWKVNTMHANTSYECNACIDT